MIITNRTRDFIRSPGRPYLRVFFAGDLLGVAVLGGAFLAVGAFFAVGFTGGFLGATFGGGADLP